MRRKYVLMIDYIDKKVPLPNTTGAKQNTIPRTALTLTTPLDSSIRKILKSVLGYKKRKNLKTTIFSIKHFFHNNLTQLYRYVKLNF